MSLQALPVSPMPPPEPALATTCFSIQAVAEPSVLLRVLEVFAKTGLIPRRCYSDLGGVRRGEITIDLQVDGVSRSRADHAAAVIREMVPVTSVLTCERHTG